MTRPACSLIPLAIFALAALLPTSSAFGYTIHQSGEYHYIIECEDESTLSIHSDLNGAITNATIFCQEGSHGASSGHGDHTSQVRRATPELARQVEACERSGGQRLRRDVIRCTAGPSRQRGADIQR